MPDFDPFEASLATALQADADANVAAFEPTAIARAAISRHGLPMPGLPMPGPTLRRLTRTVAPRLAIAAVIGVVAIGGAAYLLAPRLGPAIGHASATPSAQGPTSPPAPGSWTPTGIMTQARQGHTATLLADGRVLVVGGFEGDTALASAEIFDPRTGSWRPIAGLAEARGMHSAVALADGTVLVFGGVSAFGEVQDGRLVSADVVLASAELYDPLAGTWTMVGSMTAARTGSAVARLADGKVLVAGGWGTGELFGPKLASAELYDPGSRTWTSTGSMSIRRHGQGTVVLPNGAVLVAGGYNDSGRLATCEIYDPMTGTWSAAARLPERFLPDTALLLSNGKVLLAGGDVPSGPGALASAHAALYDVAAGTWSLAQPMTQARLSSRGVLLSDGRVLVSGGRINGAPSNITFATAELFDPATGRWAATADMTVSHAGHTATLLADGRVLAAGGISGSNGQAVAVAELYDPLAGS